MIKTCQGYRDLCDGVVSCGKLLDGTIEELFNQREILLHSLNRMWEAFGSGHELHPEEMDQIKAEALKTMHEAGATSGTCHECFIKTEEYLRSYIHKGKKVA